MTKITFAKYGRFIPVCMAGFVMLSLYGGSLAAVLLNAEAEMDLHKEYADLFEAQADVFQEALETCEKSKSQ